MRTFYLTISLLLTLAVSGCGGGSDSPPHIPMGTLSVNVTDSEGSQSVNGASITVYDSSNILVTRGETVNGAFDIALSPGTYTIKITAQDYLPVPQTNQSPIPFEVIDNQITTQDVALEAYPEAETTGQISGNINLGTTGAAGVLVVARDESQGLYASGSSGPDGGFAIYNVKPGSYTLEVYLSGYRETTNPVTVDVFAKENSVADTIEIEEHSNADLYGKVTFLAVVNGVVDITLVHPDTLDTIPGLSTDNSSSSLGYRLQSVPPGTYIAWASFRNDGYVMDPDRIRKFGLPMVTFTASPTDLEQNFDITDAVEIVSPTNDEELVVPVEVNTATPTFSWVKYPSAKEYVIEVFNSKGDTIWGGYDGSGVVQHTQIGANETSAVFNFDGSASATLQPNEVYRWKIYADNDATQDIQGLISSSENQMGLFTHIQN